MFQRNTLIHLRIPFSFFLLPIYCFALQQSVQVFLWPAVLIFIILHLFVYPASNAYNSFQDKDEGPIGILKAPPPVTKGLFHISLLFDVIGLALSFFLGWTIVVQVLAYSLVSRAYSWQGIRLKKYPWISFLVVSWFQGGYTFLLFWQVISYNSFEAAYTQPIFLAAVGTTLLTAGMYPLTQIYQHSEDAKRGDKTLSLLLGIRGTFISAAILFAGAMLVLWVYLAKTHQLDVFWGILAALGPVVGYFLWWAYKAWHNKIEASYEHAMRLNILSAGFLTACFTLLKWLT